MLEFIQLAGSQPPWVVAWQLILNGGWVVLLLFFLLLLKIGWLHWRQNVYFAKQKFILLAVDIPAEHEQSPKAVEHIFTALAGTHKSLIFKERYLQGAFLLPFSLELVSIEGYVQFLIYLPAVARDLVEAAIFAQYPDSQIVEVEDYTGAAPKQFPSENMSMWGSEITFVKPSFYPIRTYTSFEHSLTQSFADPLASLLEMFSKMTEGEQMWFQIVITPTDYGWQTTSQKEARRLAGINSGSKKSFISQFLGSLIDPLVDIFRQGLGLEAGQQSQQKESELYSRMLSLTPGERQTVEEIQNKASKTGFEAKLRFIYLAEKKVYNAAKGVSSFFGAMKQFQSDLNGFKPHPNSKTVANYFLVSRRLAYKQNKLLRGYRSRSMSEGGGSGHILLNTEELATLWHFPTAQIKAPQLMRNASKAVEPPSSLPVDRPNRLRPVAQLVMTPDQPVVDSGRPDMPDQLSLEEHPVKPSRPKITLDQKSDLAMQTHRESAGPPGNLPVG